jgi:uncharacterized protein (DUF362 family)
VVLKPNLVDYAPGDAINTHPLLVLAAAESFRRMGAKSVVVAEGPGHQRDTRLVLLQSGYEHSVRDEKVQFIDLNRDELIRTPLRARYTDMKQLWLPRTVLEAHLVVSMPKIKTHHWSGVTLSMKNMFGIVPGSRYGWPKNILHWKGIQESILDICATVPIHFVIADGIVAMEGNGPLNGTPRSLERIVLADDPVAADATCARLMGLEPRPHRSHSDGPLLNRRVIKKPHFLMRGDMGAYITFAELFDRQPTLDEVAEIVEKLPLREAAWTLCRMNLALRFAMQEQDRPNFGRIQQQLIAEHADDELLKRLQERFPQVSVERRPIFLPHCVLNVLRIVLTRSRFDLRLEASEETALRYALGRACLMMNSLLVTEDEQRRILVSSVRTCSQPRSSFPNDVSTDSKTLRSMCASDRSKTPTEAHPAFLTVTFAIDTWLFSPMMIPALPPTTFRFRSRTSVLPKTIPMAGGFEESELKLRPSMVTLRDERIRRRVTWRLGIGMVLGWTSVAPDELLTVRFSNPVMVTYSVQVPCTSTVFGPCLLSLEIAVFSDWPASQFTAIVSANAVIALNVSSTKTRLRRIVVTPY